MIVISGQNRLITQVKDLSEQNKALSEDNQKLITETKKLSEENQSIAKQNRDYTRCVATVFADYTQDFVPIVIENLDTCTVESRLSSNFSTGISPTTPTTNAGGDRSSEVQSGRSSSDSSSNPTTPTPPSPPDNSQEDPPITIGPIPVCVPFTNACLRQ